MVTVYGERTLNVSNLLSFSYSEPDEGSKTPVKISAGNDTIVRRKEHRLSPTKMLSNPWKARIQKDGDKFWFLLITKLGKG